MDTTTLTHAEVLSAIANGVCDEDLEAVIGIARERRDLNAKAQLRTLRPGDKVRLTSGRPAYLIGAPGTVKKINPSSAVEDLDPEWLAANPQAARRFGSALRVPAALLERVGE